MPSQANWLYLIAVSLTLAGSILLVPQVGTVINVWVIELVYYLMPIALLARRNRWRWHDAYSLKPAPVKTVVAAALAGIGVWIFNATLATAIEGVLTAFIGSNPISAHILAGLTPIDVAFLVLGAVVLAPFSEEVFFRGMMQNAYSRYGERQALIAVSVLFGLCHALNGMASVIPATLLGFALGYCALMTGSIWPCIALHAANNGMASLIQTSVLNPKSVLGLWPAIAGLEFGILMMQVIKSSGAPREESEAISPHPSSAIWRSLPLWIAVAILCLVSFGEITYRAKIGPLPPGIHQSAKIQTTSISAKEISGELPIATIQMPAASGESRDGFLIDFGFDFSAATADFEIVLIAPDGTTAWSDEWQGINLKVESSSHLIPADMEGKWNLVIVGDATKLTFFARWKVSSADSVP